MRPSARRLTTGLVWVLVTMVLLPLAIHAHDDEPFYVDLHLTEDQAMAMYVPPGHFAADYSAFGEVGILFSNSETIMTVPAVGFQPGEFTLIVLPYPMELTRSLVAGDIVSQETLLGLYLDSVQEAVPEFESGPSGITGFETGGQAIYGRGSVLLAEDRHLMASVFYLADTMAPGAIIPPEDAYPLTTRLPILVIMIAPPDEVDLFWQQYIPILGTIYFAPPLTERFQFVDPIKEYRYGGFHPEGWVTQDSLLPDLATSAAALQASDDLNFAPGQYSVSLWNNSDREALFEDLTADQLAGVQAASLTVTMADTDLSFDLPMIFRINGREVGVADLSGEGLSGNALAVRGEDGGLFMLTYWAAEGTSRRHFLTVLKIALSLENDNPSENTTEE